MNSEFVRASADDTEHPHHVDVGPDRWLPRWLSSLLVVATIGIAVDVVVQHKPPPGPRHAATSVPALPSVPTVPLPSQLAALDPMFADVYLRAMSPVPAENVVRSGSGSSCKEVQIGTSPQDDAAVAVHRALPGYTVIDIARIIDRASGLCALQVRAHDSSRTVVLISVTSPSPEAVAHWHRGVDTHFAAFEAVVVQYAQFTTRDGWTVVVGSTGPEGKQPSAMVLGALAKSPALRW